MKDYYRVLGVPREAPRDQIRRIFRKLTPIYHPDTTVLDKGYAEEKFKDLNEAYTVLSDPSKRSRHDTELKKARASNGAAGAPASPPPPPPMPEASAKVLSFGTLKPGEKRVKTFRVHNRGGPLRKAQLVAMGDSWFSITKTDKKMPINVEVTADTKGLEWGLKYGGWIEVHFDDVIEIVNLVIAIEEEPVRPELVFQWEPPEAANADYFYNLRPGEKRRAHLLVKPKFPNSGSFRVLLAEPAPTWLRVSPTVFTLDKNKTATLVVEVEAPVADERLENRFDLTFLLDD